MMGFWDTVASAEPYANNLHLAADGCGLGFGKVELFSCCLCHICSLISTLTIGWRRGVVVSGVRRMNEVNARRAWLVPGWVTVFGRVYHLGM